MHASFWEMGAALQGVRRDRVYALAGQMASAGERLSLAHAAGVEIALWRDFCETVDADPEHKMCMRAMGETQCTFVVGTGHALANVVVQALAVSPMLKSNHAEEFGSEFSMFDRDPFSNSRRDWISMSQATCKTIEAFAGSSGSHDLMELVRPVVEFGRGQSWRNLDERRGEDFHRWRPQTHGISGVPRRTPWSGADGTGVLEIGHPVYEDAHGLAEETARIATDAMLDIATAMEEFAERWVPPGSSMRNGLTADLMIKRTR